MSFLLVKTTHFAVFLLTLVGVDKLTSIKEALEVLRTNAENYINFEGERSEFSVSFGEIFAFTVRFLYF